MNTKYLYGRPMFDALVSRGFDQLSLRSYGRTERMPLSLLRRRDGASLLYMNQRFIGLTVDLHVELVHLLIVCKISTMKFIQVLHV